jgi:uncharacterized iron-regulated protein
MAMYRVLLLAFSVFLTSCVSLFYGSEAGINYANNVIDVSSFQVLDEKELENRLGSAKVILIGEKHDHPSHHRIQAQLIARLADQPIEGIWFEHFDRTQKKDLKSFDHANGTPEKLRQIIDWDNSGWPDWNLYEPLFIEVLNLKKPLYASNLDRAAVASVMKVGYEIVFNLDKVDKLKLNQGLPNGLNEKLSDLIDKTHCHRMPDSLKQKMVRAQRAKDAYMALSLGAPSQNSVKVFIAGNGHIRNDWGVPHYLQSLGYQKKDILSIGILEGQWDESLKQKDAYPYDIVFFTKVHDDRDPCEVYKESLKRLKSKT